MNNSLAGSCSGHGGYINEECACNCGWGGADCSLSMIYVVGSVGYSTRYIMVVLFSMISLLCAWNLVRSSVSAIHYQRSMSFASSSKIPRRMATHNILLVMVFLTTITNALYLIDPQCQSEISYTMHNVYGTFSMVTSLIIVTILIRLFAAAHARFDTSTRNLLPYFDAFCFVFLVIFMAIGFVLIALSNTAYYEVSGFVLLSFDICGVLHIGMLNIGASIYAFTTLEELIKKNGPGQASAKRLLTTMKVIRYVTITCVTLLIGRLGLDPYNQDLLMQFIVEFIFRGLVFIGCTVTLFVINNISRKFNAIQSTHVVVYPHVLAIDIIK